MVTHIRLKHPMGECRGRGLSYQRHKRRVSALRLFCFHLICLCGYNAYVEDTLSAKLCYFIGFFKILLVHNNVRNLKVSTTCKFKWKTKHPVLKQILFEIKPR